MERGEKMTTEYEEAEKLRDAIRTASTESLIRLIAFIISARYCEDLSNVREIIKILEEDKKKKPKVK
jgi:hypothetical protein